MIPSPPTDNLYRFAAIAGLLIPIASIFFVFDRVAELEIEVAEMEACSQTLQDLRKNGTAADDEIVTADGKRYFPHFGTRSMPGLAVLRQHQFVQKSPRLVEGRLVSSRPLTPEEEEALRRHVLSRLPAGFEVRFSYRERIARSPTGKFEDFMSELG